MTEGMRMCARRECSGCRELSFLRKATGSILVSNQGDPEQICQLFAEREQDRGDVLLMGAEK